MLMTTIMTVVMSVSNIANKKINFKSLWEIVANAVGKCSIHTSVERNTVQND